MKNNNILMGIICIIISGLGFSLMAVFVKMSGDLPVMQKSFFRNLIAAVVATVPLIKTAKVISYPSDLKSWFALVLRSLLGTIGMICNFYAVGIIPLADASVILKISPFVVLVLSYLIFKEQINKISIFAIICAFIGVIFVIKPSLSHIMSIGALIALFGSFMAGGAYTAVRYLGMRKVSPEFIVFFFSIFSCLFVAPFVFLHYKPMTNYQFLMLILVGIFATVGQFGITYAYRFAAARNISVFDYIQIIFSGLFGYIFFSEIPDIYSFIGYFIIVSMGVLVAFRKS